MPNWCTNKWQVNCEDEAQRDRVLIDLGLDPAKIDPGEVEGMRFSKLVPAEEGGVGDEGDRKWGTKWEPSGVKLDDIWTDGFELTFETAWGPPDKWFQVLQDEHPDVSFVALYYEPGVGIAGYLNK